MKLLNSKRWLSFILFLIFVAIPISIYAATWWSYGNETNIVSTDEFIVGSSTRGNVKNVLWTDLLSEIAADGTLQTKLTNEAGLYSALSDVSQFYEPGDLLRTEASNSPTALSSEGEMNVDTDDERFQIRVNSTNRIFDFSSDTNNYVLKSNGSGLFTMQADNGTPIILDLADDASNESTSIGEIATINDTNNIVTEPSSDKVRFNMAQNWPTADSANAGDSATAFFSAGTLEHERGGLEANVSAYSGLLGISGGATSEVDSESELYGMLSDVSQFYEPGDLLRTEASNSPTALTSNGQINFDNDDDQMLFRIDGTTYTFDFTDDAANYVLKSNGSGTLTMQAEAGGAPADAHYWTDQADGDLSSEVVVNSAASLETAANLGAYASDFLAATSEANLKSIINLEIGTDVLAPNGDGSGLSGVVTSESDPTALLTAGTDNVKDTHIDWGTSTNQVSGGDIPLDVTNFDTNLSGSDSDVQTAFETLDELASAGVEVQDQTFNSTNFDGDTTHGASQDDVYDRFHLFDADDDGDFTDEAWFPSASGAPTDAYYWTSQAEAGLSNEQVINSAAALETAASLGAYASDLLSTTSEANFKSTVNLEAGTDIQAYDADLAAIAGLTSAANKLPYFTGSGTADVADLTAFARTLLDDADQATAQTTLGLGTSDNPQFATIELGAASDTTIARSGAGAITVEGTAVLLSGGALGTPSSGVGTNLTALDGNNLQDDTVDDDSLDFGTGADQISGADIPLDVTNFDNQLSGTDTDVQKAFETLDELTSGSAPADAHYWTDQAEAGLSAEVVVNTAATLETAANLGAFFSDYADDADQATMQTTLGLGTSDNPQFATIELGDATDTTIARSGAGAITVEGTQVLLSGAALGTPSSGVGTNLTALNGENIQDDTIDDDSIDFGTGTDQISAVDIPADVTNFDGNLSGTDTTVQQALETLDELSASGDITGVLDDATGAVPVLFQSWTAFSASDATPDVSSASTFRTVDTTTITDFDGSPVDGQFLYTYCGAATVFDLTSSGLDSWNRSTDLTCTDGEVLAWKYYDGSAKWHCQNCPDETVTLSSDGIVVNDGGVAEAVSMGDGDGITWTNADGTDGNPTPTVAYPVTFERTITDPTDSDDLYWFKAPAALTLTGIDCIAQGSSQSITVDLQECDSSGASCSTVLSSAITCNGGNDAGTISDSSIAADAWMYVALGAPSGTVSAVSFTLTATQ